ncbi:Glutathione S-transferase omega-like 2 [Hondaea fermentalgiana]|uniref:Glutathione S-transferase omega-like 2 n=1 Tax=Hondaea fermentalgiana TaxID=2315210 RepID=A0A2R5GUN6_9STRA|nr:Glutathione S-transferase omega-like 2 [Hondaea fermentalgiana]|eukprot:GBG31604.1 Glutathione S-transferase omega-like 2 [Hondaea fermentalgiana]
MPGDKKAKEGWVTTGEKGDFKRAESVFRNWIKADGSTEFPVEKDRYVVYISYACPWASRVYAAINLLGLRDVFEIIPVEDVFQRTRPDDPDDEHKGWVFSERRPDTLLGTSTIREIYELQDPDVETRYTVPIVFDKKQKRIVSNESAEILRMINSEFGSLRDKDSGPLAEIDLYPEDLREAIDEVNAWVYPQLNNGVYRCGFAVKQEAYDEAVSDVWDALDKAEAILARQRYMTGDRFTEADLRLFVTCIRYDEIYAEHFKCTRRIADTCPNLWGFTREIYQMPGIKETVVLDACSNHYRKSHPTINPHGIIPISYFRIKSSKPFPECAYEAFSAPHGRDKAGRASKSGFRAMFSSSH